MTTSVGLIISLICVVLWAISLKYAEKRNKDLRHHKDVISDYIGGSKWLQYGFIFLTLGLIIFGVLISHNAAAICFYIGALGAFMVSATRSFVDTKGTHNDWLHIVAAGLAFAVTTLGCLIASFGVAPGLFGFALSIPIFSLLALDLRFDNGDKERIVAYPLVLWFIINVVGYFMGIPAWTIL